MLATKIMDKYRQGGMLGLIRLVELNVVDAVARTADRLFDLRHGTETSTPIHRPNLALDGENARHGTSYFPTPWWTFRQILRNLDIDPSQYVLIDFGSGKGRVPLMATAFRRAIGVEYSERLHQIALRNLGACRGAGNVRFVCEDAARFRLPDEPCVLYFFNPFDEVVLASVLRLGCRYDGGRGCRHRPCLTWPDEPD